MSDAGGLDLPVPTFLCSEAVLGLSGVVFMLAGVAATGEDAFFSIISAGIFCPKISNEGNSETLYFHRSGKKVITTRKPRRILHTPRDKQTSPPAKS